MNKLLLCIFVLSLVPVAHADFIVSPQSTAALRAGFHPFLLTSSETPSIRLQEVHAAGDFLGAAGPILLINGISYSAPTWSGRVPIDITLANIEIRMSTTPKNPDGLSASFADNIGSDQVVVYSGPLHFYETGSGTYDIHIPTAPFRYDPSAGNLLIDFFNYAPIASRRDPDWVIDVADQFLDSVSTISGRVTDGTGGASTIAPITRFTYTPVPEPSTWAIVMIGALAFAIARLKRAQRRGR